MILDFRLPIFDYGNLMHNTLLKRFQNSCSDNLKSKTCPEISRRIENRKWAGFSVIAFVLVVTGPVAQAQQPAKIPRVAWITGSSLSSNAHRIEAFRQGLRELGYTEGKNIVIEWRYGEEKAERVNDLAIELVRLKVDAIVTSGNSATEAAKKVTNNIPIVMTQASDPVNSGFVASLARPGGIITGLASLSPEIGGKQLELLKEIIPKLSRAAVIGTSTLPGHAQRLKELELAAKALRVELYYLDVLGPKDIETAFREASKERTDAVVLLG